MYGQCQRAKPAPSDDRDVVEQILLHFGFERCEGRLPAFNFVWIAQIEAEARAGILIERRQATKHIVIRGVFGHHFLREMRRDRLCLACDGIEAHDHLFIEEVALIVLARFVIRLKDLKENARLREIAVREFLFNQSEDFGALFVNIFGPAKIAEQQILEDSELGLAELRLGGQMFIFDEDRKICAHGRNIRALEDPDLATVPIIALTANAFSEDEEAAKRSGMQAHISKPIEVDVLMRTLAEILSESETQS